jgi:putative transposase
MYQAVKPPNQDLYTMIEIFRQMVDDGIRIGLDSKLFNSKEIIPLSYHKLEHYQILSSYKLNAISQACGRLSQMRQSIKRGIRTKP